MNKKIKEVTGMGANGGANVQISVSPMGVIAKGQKGDGKKKTKFKKVKVFNEVEKSEQALRETIRKIIFLNKVKFYEEKAKVSLNENKLRKVIRYLLKEEDDPALSSLTTTGSIKAYKAFKNTLTGIKNSYKDLVSSKSQRQSFKDIFYDGVAEYFRKLEKIGAEAAPVEKPENKNVNEPVLPRTTEPVADPDLTGPDAQADMEEPLNAEENPLAEQDENPDAEPAEETEASPEAIKAKEAEAEKFRKQLAAQTVASVQQSRQDVNVTGAKEAYDSLKTALPQLGAEFAKLSDPEDKKAFIDLLLGPNEDEAQSTIVSTVDAFEVELNNTNPKTREG